MIPIHLDPAFVRIGLIGNGALTLRRLNWLRDLGHEPQVWADTPEPELSRAAGDAFIKALPTREDLQSLHVVWMADLEPAAAAELAAMARAQKVLVNVEDVLPLCDFHTPAVVRRGALLVSAGTGGTSPAAAGFVRRILDAVFPPIWGDVLCDLAALRTAMRGEGASPKAVIAAAKARLSDEATAVQIAPCGKASCILLTHAQGQVTG